VADLRRLAELEKNKMEAVLFTHNDLCECCGEAGELLCCATCNLGKFAHVTFVSPFLLVIAIYSDKKCVSICSLSFWLLSQHDC